MPTKRFHWSDFFNAGFFAEFFIFGFTQLLGYFILIRAVPVEQAVQVKDISPLTFLIIFFIFSALLLVLLIKFPKTILLKGLFYLALFEGLTIVGQSLGFRPIIFAVVMLLLYMIIYTIAIHDLVLVLSIAGLGVLLGNSLNIISAIAILLVLALYDYIAVYKTKHMVTLFKGMAERHVVFAVIIPYRLRDYAHSLNLVALDERYMFLGTGDLAVPLILLAAVHHQQPGLSGWVIAGSMAGLFILYLQYLTRKERQALPGLPPLVGGALAGYLIGLLLM